MIIRKSSLYKSLLFMFLLQMSAASSFSQKPNADWMRHVKFGVMVHYLSFLQNGTIAPWPMGQKPTSWDSCVNAFDANLFASQMHDVGAGYVIFTLYQGTQYICAPNSYFEKATGYARGQATSHRDLILDLSNALRKYNIKLILYVTADGTFRDDRSNNAFQSPMRKFKENGNRFLSNNTWINNWAPVLKEWSLRYGKRADGWFIDGSFESHGFTEASLRKFYLALRAGSSQSLIAFSNSVHPTIEAFTKWDDYTAGEMEIFKDLPPAGGKVNGQQWHLVSFLGSDWYSPYVRYKPAEVISYINKVKSLGGVITMDAAVLRNGSLPAEQLSFLKEVSSQVTAN